MFVSNRQIEDARLATDASPFAWKFERSSERIEISASGRAAGHSFGIPAVAFGVAEGLATAGPNPLLELVGDFELRLRRTADDFHRATPWPLWTRSQEDAMTYTEQVDAALDDYRGMSLIGLSLGPEEWSGFLGETGLKPDEFGAVEQRGVPVSAGMSGIKYIVGD